MAKVVQIEKAEKTHKEQAIEDVEIRIHKSINFDEQEDPTDIFYHDAEELFDALRSLPGGTFDRLLILMLNKTASSFIVPHNFHDGKERELAPLSMLALLEKALPMIQREASNREAALDHSRYAFELRELANEISAEIDKAKGKEASHG